MHRSDMVNARNRLPRSQELAEPYRSWEAYELTDEESDFDLATAFKDLVQRDPVVCDNCFLRRYTQVTAEWWRGSFGWLDYDRWVPFPDRVEPVPADSTSGGTRLACGNCGHRKTKSRPIPKREIPDYALRISDTLDAKSIDHDAEVLFEEVESRNTSDNQGKQDSDVFAPAVRISIRATRR